MSERVFMFHNVMIGCCCLVLRDSWGLWQTGLLSFVGTACATFGLLGLLHLRYEERRKEAR